MAAQVPDFRLHTLWDTWTNRPLNELRATTWWHRIVPQTATSSPPYFSTYLLNVSHNLTRLTRDKYAHLAKILRRVSAFGLALTATSGNSNSVPLSTSYGVIPPQDPFPEEHGPIDSVMQRILVGSLLLFVKTAMNTGNKNKVYYKERFYNALYNRTPGQGLITVCNHVSSLDDPVLWSVLLPVSVLRDLHYLRWTFCATDHCFREDRGFLLKKFFEYTKVLPIVRGGGLEQAELGTGVLKLNCGAWIHLFPEGTRTRDGTIGRPRLGVARLVAGTIVPPVVLPIVHEGIESIMPIGSNFPSFFNNVFYVLVGEPINFDDLIADHHQRGSNHKELFQAIADRIGERLRQLREELKSRIEQERKAASQDQPSRE